MKKELQVTEGFDSVKTFRRLKTKISLEMKDMTHDQIVARLALASKEYKLKNQLIIKSVKLRDSK